MDLLQIDEPTDNNIKKRHAFGIDLGTTNSLIASSINQKSEIIGEIEPSIVSVTNKEIKIGNEASIESDFCTSFKRLMGKNKRDIGNDVEKLNFNFDDDNDQLTVKLANLTFTAEELSAKILLKLKNKAEEKFQSEIKECVITVPAYFDDGARNATKISAKLAGLEVLRLINEPTAAMLSYGLDKKEKGLFLAYDLGGGTFDISLVKLSQGIFQVIATSGDTVLGGDDIDNAIVKYIAEKFNIEINKANFKELRLIARKIKESLNENETCQFCFKDIKGEVNLKELMSISDEIYNKTLKLCDEVLEDSEKNIEEIDEIILVGGSTKSKILRKKIENHFNKKPLCNIDPDKVVALGAALQADSLVNGSDNLLLDVNPLSLSVEIMGGMVERIIERNSAIPISKYKEYTTYLDGQTSMKIHVLQGERELVEDNRSLAEFTLDNIPPLKAGIARVKVGFSLDMDGILTVSAQELTTNIKQEIIVKPTYGIDENKVTEILYDSLSHQQEDQKQKELLEVKFEAETILNHIKQSIEEDTELLDQENAKLINLKMQNLADSLNQNKVELIKLNLNELEKIAEKFDQARMDKHFNQALKGKRIKDI